MRKLNQQIVAFLFVAGTLLFTACGSPVEEIEDPYVPLTRLDFEIRTLQPDVSNKVVTLKGEFDLRQLDPGQELKWGFLWMKDGEDRSQDLRRINVGRGYEDGSFKLQVTDLPAETDLVVCAFVEAILDQDDEPTVLTGEEVFFGNF